MAATFTWDPAVPNNEFTVGTRFYSNHANQIQVALNEHATELNTLAGLVGQSLNTDDAVTFASLGITGALTAGGAVIGASSNPYGQQAHIQGGLTVTGFSGGGQTSGLRLASNTAGDIVSIIPIIEETVNTSAELKYNSNTSRWEIETDVQIDGALTAGNTTVNGGVQSITHTLYNGGAGTDLKYWQILGATNGDLLFRDLNDSKTPVKDAMKLGKNGSLTAGSASISGTVNGGTLSLGTSTAVGLSASSAGDTSTALGYGASSAGLNSTALGRGANATKVNSTALGSYANAAGDYSIALGVTASSAGNNSTALGYGANAAGASSTALGRSAGSTMTSSSTNVTCVGYNAQPSSGTVINEITLGNTSVTTLRCNTTSITSLSDARDKADIQDITLGLDFIKEIKPRMFKWDRREWYEGEKDGSKKSDAWTEGLIAQELLETQTKYNADWLKAVLTTNPDRYEVAPSKIIIPLIKAVQELADKVEALEKRLTEVGI